MALQKETKPEVMLTSMSKENQTFTSQIVFDENPQIFLKPLSSANQLRELYL